MTAAMMRSLTAYGNLVGGAAERIPAPGSMTHQLIIRRRPAVSSRALCVAVIATVLGATAVASAQTQVRKPRRQFVTLSLESFVTQPLHFERFPVQDLVGAPVALTQFKDYDYETRDGSVLVDVLNFTRRGHGAGITVYPFGASVGPTLAVRAGVQDLPDIRIAFSGPRAPVEYQLAGARAYDVGAAILVADHSRGWGLGSQAFVGGGTGRIHSETHTGDRLYAEAGGGISSGPFGVELAVKFAWNHLTDPVDHHFFTVPVTLRGTLSF
jgi:hypothetical protein